MQPLRERIHFLGTQTLHKPVRGNHMGCVLASFSTIDNCVDNYNSIRQAVTCAVNEYHVLMPRVRYPMDEHMDNNEILPQLQHDVPPVRPNENRDAHMYNSPPPSPSVIEYRTPIPQ